MFIIDKSLLLVRFYSAHYRVVSSLVVVIILPINMCTWYDDVFLVVVVGGEHSRSGTVKGRTAAHVAGAAFGRDS